MDCERFGMLFASECLCQRWRVSKMHQSVIKTQRPGMHIAKVAKTHGVRRAESLLSGPETFSKPKRTLWMGRPLWIAHVNVTLRSQGHGAVLDAQHRSRIATPESSHLSLAGIHLSNGGDVVGAALSLTSSTASLIGCTITSCVASSSAGIARGGALYVTSSSSAHLCAWRRVA